jgi:hypothetical protein
LFFFVICLFLKKSRGRYKYRKKSYGNFQQYFSYIVAVSFIGGGNQSTRRKPSIYIQLTYDHEWWEKANYLIIYKFLNNYRSIDGFLRVLWFPPPIKLTATI